MKLTPFIKSKSLVSLAAVMLCSCAPGWANGKPFVIQASQHDVSEPLRVLQRFASVALTSDLDPDADVRPYRRVQPDSTTQPDPVLQTSATTSGAFSTILNFAGVSATGSFAVPDTNGAPGATQYVQWVNDSFAVYNKTNGSLVMGPVLGKTLWAGFGGPCANKNNGDIIAQYDKLQNVWVMTQFAVAGGPPYYQCLAVSTSSDATGTYHRYAFRLPDFFPDYPKLGVWPDAYYMTWNLLNQTNKFVFVAPLVCAFDRNSIIAGTAATMQCFQLSSAYSSLLPSDLDGSTQPPAGSPDYLIDLDVNSLDLWQFHVDFQRPANSAISGPVSLAVAPFTEACGGNVCIPQSGTTQHLDSLGDRLMYRFAYRNFGDHESLVVSHAVGKPSAIRWYELRDPGGSPFIYQQGTFAPDLNWRWMPSVAMDKVGDLALGFSMSSPKMHPSIRYAGRQPGDALGTLSNGNNVMTGPASQQGSNRWGDYSSMAVDPVDDCTFWYTNEYVPTLGDFNWHTRIAAFKFAGCN